MKHSRKKVLIDRDEYDRLKAPLQTPLSSDPYYIPHPSAKAAKSHHQEANAALTSSSKTEFEKTLLHAQKIEQYLQSLRDALTIPKAVAYTGVKQSHPPPPSPPSPDKVSTTTTTTTTDHPIHQSPTPPDGDEASSHRVDESTPKRSSRVVTTPTSKRKRLVRKKKPPSLPTPPSTPHAASSGSFSSSRLLTQLAPKRNVEREHLSNIVDKLSSNPDFSWNQSTGKIRYKKKLYRASNIKSLLADVASGKRHLSDKTSYDAMLQALE